MATYYVDFASGADTNDGLASSTPWKHCPGDANATDTAAAATLSGGDTVYLKRGVTYSGVIVESHGGTTKESGTDGAINVTGYVLTSAGATFLTNGVALGDKLFINGEGWFEVDSVDSETQLTLTTPTAHKNLSGVAYHIASWVTYTTTTGWGSGAAVINGRFTLSGVDNVVIDGGTSRGIVLTAYADWLIYCSNATADQYAGLIFRRLYVHDNGADNKGGIYIRNANYCLIDDCEIAYNGNTDAVTGDDGIYIVSDSRYITIQDNNIHHNGDDGIQLAAAHSSYVQHNSLHHSGLDSGDVHPDAIATNAASNFDCVIRYNTIYDNRNNTDLEHVNLEFYGNVIYDTSVGAPGNHGIRVKEGVTGTVYNNTVAWCNTGLYSYDTSGAIDIQNNIFFENGDQGTGPEVRINTGDTCKNNIYKRVDVGATTDIISYNSTLYTLSEFQAAGLGPGSDNGTGSLAWTALESDWSGSLFADETRSAPDFAPAANGAQIDAGAVLGTTYAYDITGKTRPVGVAWDIGAYEYSSGGGSGMSYAIATITNPSSELTNFTAEVDLSRMPSASWWAAVTSSDGTKGRVFSGDGNTELAADWIGFNDSGETGLVRFLIPTLAASGTQQFRIYPPLSGNASYAAGDPYGSDNAYASHWEAYYPDGGGTDRTMNGNDLTDHGSPIIGGATGKLNKATDYNGSNQWSDRTSAVVTGNPYTFVAWFEPDNITAEMSIISVTDVSETAVYSELQAAGNVGGDPVRARFLNTVLGDADTTSGFSQDTWTMAVGRFQTDAGGTQNSALINASAEGMDSPDGTHSTLDTTTIARRGDATPSAYFDGALCELQVHSAYLSDAWITEEYAQVNDQSTFWGTWVWTTPAATYAVTYNANTADSGSAPTDGSSPYAESATVTVLGNTGSLTKTGYTFNGWNTAANGSGTAYSADDTFSMPASDTTLYAQWTAVGSVIDDHSAGSAMAILMGHPSMRAIGNL